MERDQLMFFEGHMEALPIYERLLDAVSEIEPEVKIKVSKTQIGFFNRHGFAFVSFAPVLPKRERPPVWLTLSLGLGYRLDSPRVAQAVEPYPGRWTNHLLLSSPGEVDQELKGWLREAADFAMLKGRR